MWGGPGQDDGWPRTRVGSAVTVTDLGGCPCLRTTVGVDCFSLLPFGFGFDGSG